MAATLKVRVIPRARRNEISGWREGALVVRLTAPPVEGAANKLLLRFVSQQLGVRPTDVTLASGERSREKVLRIETLTQDDLNALLPPAP
ncbi:MAG: YggU family protein [Armatimonadetes bacterium]|nr:YggU family protein [Armatimonadota bacterium]